MKVVLLGANGQVGKEVQRLYNEYKNVDIDYYDIMPYSCKGMELFAYGKDELDITHENQIISKLVELNPDFVINCAAYTDVTNANDNEDQAMLINGTAVGYLAKICRTIDTTLIHISTDYVFDGLKGQPYTEEDKPNPLNVYGKSKLMGEDEIRRLYDKHFILRTSWVYSQYNNNFLNTILNRMGKGENVNVVCDQIGCPTSASKVAEAILCFCSDFDVYGTYHLRNDEVMSWYEFTKVIRDTATYFTHIDTVVNPITTQALKSKVKRPYYSVLDCTKFSEEFPNFNFNSLDALYATLYNKYGKVEPEGDLKQIIENLTAGKNEHAFMRLYKRIENLEKRVDKRK